MGESAREPSCSPDSPPPYTPLPLSGHVTLMLGQGSSPDKRQDTATPVRDREEQATDPLLERSFTRDPQQSLGEPSSSVSMTTVAEQPPGVDSLPNDILPPQSLRLTNLSSSFPSARPPSPFPRSRSLSFQLPPLRSLSQPRPSSSEPHPPLRLPPLREVASSCHQRPRKRTRARSRSCQLQTNSLSPSVQEHTLTIIQ